MGPMISCQEETMMGMTADYYLESPPPPSSLPQHSSPPSSSPNTSGVKIFLMNLMVASSHPPALTSHHADPHDPHCAAPSHISPSLHFHCSSSPRPLQRFLCSGHTPIFLPFLLSFLVVFFLFLFTVSSSPGTVATHPAEDSKLARTRFPPAAAPALGPTTGAQPLSEGGGEVPRSAMVTRVQHSAAQCAVQSTVHLQCRTERRQPASLLVQVRLSSFASHFIPVLRLQRLT